MISFPESKVVKIVDRGTILDSGREVLTQLISLAEQSQDSRKSNYSLAGLKLDSHLSYDALVDSSGELVTSCGLFNGGRYPSGTFRCLNRVFVNPKYRVDHGSFPAYATRHLLPAQIERYQDEIQVLFVSRENPKSRAFLERWVRTQTDGNWEVPEDMFQVVPKGRAQSSYQCVAIRSGNWGHWNPERISTQEWRNLFSPKDF